MDFDVVQVTLLQYFPWFFDYLGGITLQEYIFALAGVWVSAAFIRRVVFTGVRGSSEDVAEVVTDND